MTDLQLEGQLNKSLVLRGFFCVLVLARSVLVLVGSAIDRLERFILKLRCVTQVGCRTLLTIRLPLSRCDSYTVLPGVYSL